MTIVLVEQHFEFAHDLAGRFTALKRDLVVMERTRAELLKDALKQSVSV